MVGIGFILGFLLAFPSVRNAVWVFAGYVWLRSDPPGFLLWTGAALGCALAWSLARRTADGA